jgi:hypothetical protein
MTWQPGSCGRASRGYVTANGRCANDHVDRPLPSEQVRLVEEAARLALSQTAKPGLRILAPLRCRVVATLSEAAPTERCGRWDRPCEALSGVMRLGSARRNTTLPGRRRRPHAHQGSRA